MRSRSWDIGGLGGVILETILLASLPFVLTCKAEPWIFSLSGCPDRTRIYKIMCNHFLRVQAATPWEQKERRAAVSQSQLLYHG